MSFNDFIASNQPTHRICRHMIFWGVYAIHYYLQSLIPVKQMFYSAFISACCFLPACVIAVYTLIYIALPVLRARKFVLFVTSIIFLVSSLVILNYYMSVTFFFLTCECELRNIPFGTILGLNLGNTAHALITGFLVLGFKLAKDWLANQKENQKLLNQRISNELRLQKARIYPSFLFLAMRNLQEKLKHESSDSPEIILKLSDVLSYLLYESSEDVVTVEREVDIVATYLAVEELIHPNRVSIQTQMTPDSKGKCIRPMVLFNLLQECCEPLGRSWGKNYALDLNVSAKDDMMRVTLRVTLLEELSNLSQWERLTEDIASSVRNLTSAGQDVRYTAQHYTTDIEMNVQLASSAAS